MDFKCIFDKIPQEEAMKFSPTFLFYNIEVYDPLIRNFRVWALEKRV